MVKSKKLMACGHAANATFDGEPACAICRKTEAAQVQMDLEGRSAWCVLCGENTQSSTNLPFFEYRPNLDTDTYYCGCWGWD